MLLFHACSFSPLARQCSLFFVCSSKVFHQVNEVNEEANEILGFKWHFSQCNEEYVTWIIKKIQRSLTAKAATITVILATFYF